MVDKNDVAAVLELIRPSLQADGGDVQLVDVAEDGTVSVRNRDTDETTVMTVDQLIAMLKEEISTRKS